MLRAATVLAATLLSGTAEAARLFAFDNANRLYSFESSAPGTFQSTVQVVGLDSGLQAIDFRPLNGALFGYTEGNRLYTIDLVSGVATAVGGANPVSGNEFGFDFNPTIDRIRLVADTNSNSVLNPDTGGFTATTPVFFATGDPNEGRDPDIVANAYTPSSLGAPGSSTQLFSIDARNNLLARQANSAGTLNTVGALGVDISPAAAFDIAVDGQAFVLDGRDLFTANLQTGRLTAIGETQISLGGLAAQPVPAPAGAGLLMLALGLLGLVRRRAA